MKRFTPSVVLVVALGLAGCSGGHSSVVPSGALPAAAGTRAAQSSTGTLSFTYVAHPPRSLAFSAAKYTSNALPTPSQCVALYGVACYTPQEIRTGYDVPSSLTGAGQTIVIVDAYGSPTIATDLQQFSAFFGLPNATLNIITPEGPVTNPVDDINTEGWADETSLDVEWAHAIAPGATIDLVLAPTNDGNDLENAERYAINNKLGNVMTMSFGAPELNDNGKLDLQDHFLAIDLLYTKAVAQGISLFASSGDLGASDGTPYVSAGFPASDPHVVSVGGTNLFLADDGTYESETTWNDVDPTTCPFGCQLGAFGATGGAPSKIFPALLQAPFNHNLFRTTSDVSYDASVYTAVLVLESWSGTPEFYFVGGTSSGSPQWAAITALADQKAGHGLGLVGPSLYAASVSHPGAFHDVTVGNNNIGAGGFNAGPGYDIPTGLGSPDVAKLLNALH